MFKDKRRRTTMLLYLANILSLKDDSIRTAPNRAFTVLLELINSSLSQPKTTATIMCNTLKHEYNLISY